MKTMLSRLARYRKQVAQSVAALGLLWMTMPVPFSGLREKLTHWAVGGVEVLSEEDMKGADSITSDMTKVTCEIPPK